VDVSEAAFAFELLQVIDGIFFSRPQHGAELQKRGARSISIRRPASAGILAGLLLQKPNYAGKDASAPRGAAFAMSINKMSLPNLAAEQGQIWGWEFAMLSFPC